MWIPFDLDTVSMVMIVGMIAIFVALAIYQFVLVRREGDPGRKDP